ncbi:MAG: AAA domain-containing protein [Bdellovibrionales bacterium]|jgi:ATP-dependent Clp protease ATP-binding subunit ClpX|nr:AAA domain-containing protein [Bdellovibrionales bacterium]MBT3525899.1 AAA domain-containing protein [Bdellovibrionales bacterium]MBT7670048.1 AAA domain-containing protein [Bdellovibrionales bacterium]MBT7765903.1 AAA domain-containing protein [Bdellovibrionales bacterium]
MDHSPINPDDIHKELEELVKAKFGDKVKVVSQMHSVDGQSLPSLDIAEMDDEGSEEAIDNSSPLDLEFAHTPKSVTAYLDRYVIGQSEAKKALSIAVCDHYNYIKQLDAQRNALEQLEEEVEDNYVKQNVLVLGPTGVGKTYLVRMIAKLIGVPFVKADATRFTETGYVGSNVDDLVRDLVSMANGDINLAQYGIIYLDEVDKLAGGGSDHGNKDVSRRGVQYGLLKLMEETEIDLRSSHDMISQIQAMMDFQREGKVSKKVINTKHILFIVSGAFSGLEDVIKKRLKMRTIGLTSDNTQQSKSKQGSESMLLHQVTTKDLMDFGFEPEFVGRLPVRLICNALSKKDLYAVLRDSLGSIVHQYVTSFRLYGIELSFEDRALKRLAEIAYDEQTGARGLMTICERLFREYKFQLPSTGITKLVVTHKMIDHPQQELKRLLKKIKLDTIQ